MSRPSLSWPLSIIAGFAVLIAFLIIGALDQPAGAQGGNCAPGQTAYPNCYYQTETAEVGNIVASETAQREQTQAALSCREGQAAYPLCATQTAQAEQPATETPDSNGGGNGGGNNNDQPAQSTSTSTATATRTVVATATGGATPTFGAAAPTATTANEAEEPAGALPTPTSVLPPGVSAIACIPGETVDIFGTTRPNIALLVFFDDRPVGGGLSAADGSYRIGLEIGDERPGIYLVEVRERVTRELIQQLGCDVPAFTPTPTIPAAG